MAKGALPLAQLMPVPPESRAVPITDRQGVMQSPGADGNAVQSSSIRGRDLIPKGGTQLCSRDPS